MRTGDFIGVLIKRDFYGWEAEGCVQVPHDSDYFGLQDAALAIGEIIIDACARQKPSEAIEIQIVNTETPEFNKLHNGPSPTLSTYILDTVQLTEFGIED